MQDVGAVCRDCDVAVLVGIGALLLLAQYFVTEDIASAGQQAQQAASSVGSGITLKGLIGV